MLQTLKKIAGGKTAPQKPKAERPKLDRALFEKPVNESRGRLEQAQREYDARVNSSNATDARMEELQKRFDDDPSEANETALFAGRKAQESARLHVDRAARLQRLAETELAGVEAARDEGIRAYYQQRVDAIAGEATELWDAKGKAAFDAVGAFLEELDALFVEGHSAILELTKGQPDLQFAKVSGLKATQRTRIRTLAREQIGVSTLEKIEQICT